MHAMRPTTNIPSCTVARQDGHVVCWNLLLALDYMLCRNCDHTVACYRGLVKVYSLVRVSPLLDSCVVGYCLVTILSLDTDPHTQRSLTAVLANASVLVVYVNRSLCRKRNRFIIFCNMYACRPTSICCIVDFHTSQTPSDPLQYSLTTAACLLARCNRCSVSISAVDILRSARGRAHRHK